jgi:hypothetical protein
MLRSWWQNRGLYKRASGALDEPVGDALVGLVRVEQPVEMHVGEGTLDGLQRLGERGVARFGVVRDEEMTDAKRSGCA